MKQAKKSKFAVGRRWRVLEGISSTRCGVRYSDFLIIGPADYGDPKNGKLCRLEVEGHAERCCPSCTHGIEQTYPHKHLKKYGFLVDEDASYTHTSQKPGWTCTRADDHDGPCALVQA